MDKYLLCHHFFDLLEDLRDGMSWINSPIEVYWMTCEIMKFSVFFALHGVFDVCFHAFIEPGYS